MPHAVGMLLGAAKAIWKTIIGPNTIVTGTMGGSFSDMIPDGHHFTMSDGQKIAVFRNGSQVEYVKTTAGTWGAAVQIRATNMPCACVQNGDNVFVVVNIAGEGGAQSIIAYKLAYSAGTVTVTTGSAYNSRSNTGATVMGAYYDTSNNLVHVAYDSTDNINGNSFQLVAISATTCNVAYSSAALPAITATANAGRWRSIAGDGTSTFYLVASNGGTALVVYKVVAAAGSYTSTTQESGITALAANCFTLDAVWDGANLVVIANENGLKLRVMTRTGVNTYSAWTDIATSTALNNPSACVTPVGNIAVFYSTTASQANGEIYYVTRVGGSWGTATRLAGGAATGWFGPSANPTTLNTNGAARVIYGTGTGSPFSYKEDGLN